MTDITPLSADALATLVEDFEASDHNRMAMNAVTALASTRWHATMTAPA